MPLPERVRRYTFYTLGGFIFLALASIILYNNYLLIEPHLHIIFWSMCTSILLTKLKQPIKSFLISYTKSIDYKIRIVFALFFWANYAYFLMNFLIRWFEYNHGQRFMFTLIYILVAMILLSPFLLTTDTLSTIVTMIVASFVLISITLLVARTGYIESKKATELIGDFIDKNKDVFLESINNYKNAIVEQTNNHSNLLPVTKPSENVTVWKTAERYCDIMLGAANSQYDFLHNITSMVMPKKSANNTLSSLLGNKFCKKQVIYLQDNIYSFIQYLLGLVASNINILGSSLQTFFQTLVDLISNLKVLVFSSFLFILFVFYFVKHDEFFVETAKKVSPLTEEESTVIIESIDTNIIKTLYYLISFGVINFLITTFSFYLVDFEIVFIFGFLSFFLSVIPLISNWVIWLPATIYLLSRDGFVSISWVIVLVAHLSLYAIDTMLFTRLFKKRNPTLLGVSIILGIYVFGQSGILKGPLFVTLAVTLFDIFSGYVTMANKEEQIVSSGGTNVGSKRPSHSKTLSFFELFTPRGVGDEIIKEEIVAAQTTTATESSNTK